MFEAGGANASLALILPFLADIGIGSSAAELDETFLPGVQVRDGRIVYDPGKLLHPGDLLHEAGHIAVSDPAVRPTLSEIAADPAEEMAAIAWSYAAARFIGLPSAVLFHDAYAGGGPTLCENFDAGRYIGAPMLHYWGMAIEPRQAQPDGPSPYPHMLRWLR